MLAADRSKGLLPQERPGCRQGLVGEDLRQGVDVESLVVAPTTSLGDLFESGEVGRPTYGDGRSGDACPEPLGGEESEVCILAIGEGALAIVQLAIREDDDVLDGGRGLRECT